MSRLPQVEEDIDDPIARRIFDAVTERGRSVGLERVPELYRVLAQAPGVLKAWTDLAWPLRQQATIGRRIHEMMAMRVAQLTGTSYLWLHHWTAALHSGLEEHQLTALLSWSASEAFSPPERAVLRFTDEVVRDIGVSDGTFAEVKTHFPAPGQVVELTVTAAFLSCGARVIRALDIEPSPEFTGHPGMPT